MFIIINISIFELALLINLLDCKSLFTKEQNQVTILVVADVLRLLSPPVGVNHENYVHSFHSTFQNFPLHPKIVMKRARNFRTGDTRVISASRRMFRIRISRIIFSNLRRHPVLPLIVHL